MTTTTSTVTRSSLASGYRLSRLEILNWGTFDNAIWTIDPEGENALLTGDIGSGKSTLVDAITTLLVPHQKITFNKAAGAQTRERNLKTYILGAYKNEKVAETGKARDVYLRNGTQHHTVLLAVFTNATLQESITLAQVFWMSKEKIKKFYVLAEKELNILQHFSNFGSNILQLKKRLRAGDQQQVFNSFTNYSNRFRQLFGIRQPEALDLFYQTVSMKSVGNLTDFVREQMLGQTNIDQYIEELVKRYQELTEAHRAVQLAKDQYELLTPLIKSAGRRTNILRKIADLEAVVEEIPRYFASLQLAALQRELGTNLSKWETNEAHSQRERQSLQSLRDDLRSQQDALAGLGEHRRLTEIRLQLDPLMKERDRRRKQADAYAETAGQLAAGGADIPPATPLDQNEFLQRQQDCRERHSALEQALQQLNQRLPEHYVKRDRYRKQVTELERELTSLRRRPTLIPERNWQLRAGLLEELQLEETELPFVGELLQVREGAQDWEGAIERQLHSFGLSILVPDRHYTKLSRLVDQRKLGGKLVYLRTLPHRAPDPVEPEADSLVHKLRIKSDTEFYDWLENELWRHHNYQCCETLEDFRRSTRGLTRQGQSKSSRVRHTKDDRFAVNDRRRYILGWSNKAKIKALEQALQTEREALREAEASLQQLKEEEKHYDQQRELLRELLRFTDFAELDFAQTSTRIQQLRQEQQRLEQGSDQLQQIQQRIRALEQQIQVTETQWRQRSEQRGALRTELLRHTSQMYDLFVMMEMEVSAPELTAQGIPENMITLAQAYTRLVLPEVEVSPILRQRLQREHIESSSELKEILAVQHRLLESIRGSRGAIARQKEELARQEREIVQAMQKFRNRYPEESREMDADPAAIPEFRSLYERLVQDDIPRHEERFRELLKQGAIRGILSFRTKLEDYEREIKDKIASINRHLKEIDYNAGTYITILAERVRTEDILSFKQQLRACLDNIYGEQDNIYTEEKFFQVKELLDRFRGETEADARWTKRVTDVRQWYVFGADERRREDDASREYYTDSSGKSGGQKEKLAYTILASAIAFQFGLEWGRKRDRSFRFVVIDEAFGRGSDDSTRYGLQLFERLDLQLLIVTPLQKINVIEDYIAHVHYVSNRLGTRSQVRNISKEEYLREKEEHLAKSGQL